MPSMQTKDSDTDMKHQNYFWLPNTVEFVAQSTTYACGKHFNVLTLPVRQTPHDFGNGRLYNLQFFRPLRISMRGKKLVELMI